VPRGSGPARPPSRERPAPLPLLWISLASLALAGASALIWYPTPVYDAFGWAVWGRELSNGELDTTLGPSWKPLPVAVCALLSPLGESLPEAWVIVARAGFVAMVLAAAGLGMRLESSGKRPERIAAGLLGGLGALLLIGARTTLPWELSGGLGEPLTAALFLIALDRHGAGRRGSAALSLWLAGLIRPEAIVLLAVYAVLLLIRRERRPALMAGGLVGAAAVLWVVPDLIGSGDALTGADRARVRDEPLEVGEGGETLTDGLELPLAAFWIGAAWILWDTRRRRDRLPAQVAAAGLAWIAVVIAMTIAGYAGLPRFLLPGAAAICALGAAGLAGLAASVVRRRGRRARPGSSGGGRLRLAVAAAVSAVAAVLLTAQAVDRASGLPDGFELAEERAQDLADAEEAVGRAGPGRLLACDTVLYTDALAHTALAWSLDAHMDKVIQVVIPEQLRGVRERTAVVSPSEPEPFEAVRRGFLLGEAGGWRAYTFRCPAAVPRSYRAEPLRERRAGRSGATR